MKKTLSIILAILMLLSVCPVAFAADEAPDFSDAKVLTAVDGILYVNGEETDSYLNSYDEKINVLPAGKYKLGEDITTDAYIEINSGENVILDLNGYTWVLNSTHLSVDGTLSLYDTSSTQTGKMVSSGLAISVSYEFNLYSGTIEGAGNRTISAGATNSVVNLYGGKIIGETYVMTVNAGDTKVNLYGTVLESGEDYAQLQYIFYVGDTAEDAFPLMSPDTQVKI